MGKKSKFLPKFLLLVPISLFIISAGILIVSFYNSAVAKASANSLGEQAIELNKVYTSPDRLTKINSEDLGKKIVQNLQQTYNNDQVVALIEGKALVSPYPIIGSASPDDDDYWIRRNLNGDWTWEGTLFTDYNNNPDFSGWNTTVFGHRMKDNQMFGPFRYFENQEDFDKMKAEGKDIFTITSAQGKKSYKVAAVIMTQLYDRSYFRVNKDIDWLKQELNKSVVNTGYSEVEVLNAKHYLTLSTCTEASGPNRTILICYQLEK